MVKSAPAFEVTCPCCNAVLKVDTSTRAVIAHTAAVKPKMFQDIEEAARAMAEGVARVTGRLANAHYRRGTSHDALGELADMAEGDPALAAGAASPGALTWWEGLLLLLYSS